MSSYTILSKRFRYLGCHQSSKTIKEVPKLIVFRDNKPNYRVIKTYLQWQGEQWVLRQMVWRRQRHWSQKSCAQLEIIWRDRRHEDNLKTLQNAWRDLPAKNLEKLNKYRVSAVLKAKAGNVLTDYSSSLLYCMLILWYSFTSQTWVPSTPI